MVFFGSNLLPQNLDFESTKKIYYDNVMKVGGVNWDNVEWDYYGEGVELPEYEDGKYIFNSSDGTFVENPNYIGGPQ